MLRNLFLATSICLLSVGSASAATLFMPGASGIPDQDNVDGQPGGANGCTIDVPKGAMVGAPALFFQDYACLMSFPISLPAGSTIDSVEIAYRNNYIGPPNQTIAAYLGANRVKPDLGALALAGNNAVGGNYGQRFLNLPSLSIPMMNGVIYWVQVSTTNISEVSYVAITYH